MLWQHIVLGAFTSIFFSLKVKVGDGENFKSFALLGNGSQSSLRPVSLQHKFPCEARFRMSFDKFNCVLQIN